MRVCHGAGRHRGMRSEELERLSRDLVAETRRTFRGTSLEARDAHRTGVSMLAQSHRLRVSRRSLHMTSVRATTSRGGHLAELHKAEVAYLGPVSSAPETQLGPSFVGVFRRLSPGLSTRIFADGAIEGCYLVCRLCSRRLVGGLLMDFNLSTTRGQLVVYSLTACRLLADYSCLLLLDYARRDFSRRSVVDCSFRLM